MHNPKFHIALRLIRTVGVSGWVDENVNSLHGECSVCVSNTSVLTDNIGVCQNVPSFPGCSPNSLTCSTLLKSLYNSVHV